MPRKDFYVENPDDIQARILDKTLDQSLVVSGCAGSGKSIIALHKAKQIQNEKGNNYKIIVFTKSLCNYMNSAKETLNLSNEFYYHWDWKENKKCPKADYIIVDEIQDFTKEEIEEFKNAAHKHFFFFGDSAQSIYEGLRETQEVRITAFDAGLSENRLYFNYRLPKTIAKIVENYIGVKTRYEEGTYKSTENSIPRIISYPNYDKQIEAIARIIKKNNLTDVGILFPHNEQVEKASKVLTQKGINNEVQFRDRNNWRNDRNTLDFKTSNPKLMTYHSAKGLQFETVFLPDCTITNTQDNYSKQKSLYVAMTRTYKNLYVLHSNNLSPLFIKVPVNLYKTTEFDEISDI